MGYKTILVPVSPGVNRLDRLAAATDLASRFDGHLSLQYMTAPSGMPAEIAGRGASAAYLAEAAAINLEKQDGVRRELGALCDAAGVSWGWETVDGEPNEALVERSYTADLIVLHRHHADAPDAGEPLHSTDDLALKVSCPLLILPQRRCEPPVARSVVIGWKQGPTAAHAVHRALPLLAGAARTTIVVCGSRPPSLDRLISHLHRHGVGADVVVETDDGDVAAALRRHAEQQQADLVVIGAYGGARWREQLLGSDTDAILDAADRPVFLAH